MPLLTEDRPRKRGRRWCAEGCCAVAVCLILILGGATWWLLQNPKVKREGRGDPIPHTYAANTWWKYANYTARTRNPPPKVADNWYLCGHKAYPHLPPNWGGTCTLVALSDHTFIMTSVHQHPSPNLEVNMYAIMRLINNTMDITQGVSKELTALREMVLQNRMALDLVTAANGGICTIIGDTC